MVQKIYYRWLGVGNMKSPNIKVNRVWDFGGIRAMCIKHNFYTRGTNEDYAQLATFIRSRKPTYINVYKAALDICTHSSGQVVTNIMYLIERECVYTTFEINGKDDV